MQILVLPLLIAGAVTALRALAQAWPLVLLLAGAVVADEYLRRRKQAGH